MTNDSAGGTGDSRETTIQIPNEALDQLKYLYRMRFRVRERIEQAWRGERSRAQRGQLYRLRDRLDARLYDWEQQHGPPPLRPCRYCEGTGQVYVPPQGWIACDAPGCHDGWVWQTDDVDATAQQRGDCAK